MHIDVHSLVVSKPDLGALANYHAFALKHQQRRTGGGEMGTRIWKKGEMGRKRLWGHIIGTEKGYGCKQKWSELRGRTEKREGEKDSGNWEADENTIVSYFWDIIIRKMQKSVKSILKYIFNLNKNARNLNLYSNKFS